MKKYFLIPLCLIFSFWANAQDKTKYLSGAVPEVDGRVAFHRTITVKNKISEASLFDLMDKWANDNYNGGNKDLINRVLLSNPAEKDIACAGEKYLVFKRSAFVLDQAKMSYQLVLNIEQNKCDVTVRNIKFDYSDSKTTVPAEEMISDKVALNKDGSKLSRYYDKFRTHAVDSINHIFNSIDVYLNGISMGGATSSMVASTPAQVMQPAVMSEVAVHYNNEMNNIGASVSVASMPGYKLVTPDKIPGNIIKLLNDWTLITSGTADNINVMTASWGGLGVFWEKPISLCFLNPTRYSVQTMDKGETYTISFYTEAYKEALKYCGSVSGRSTDKIKGSGLTPITTPSGATAFAEAWMILECKKIVAQQISENAVVDKSVAAQWSKDGYHKIYIGEILNVWIK